MAYADLNYAYYYYDHDDCDDQDCDDGCDNYSDAFC